MARTKEGRFQDSLVEDLESLFPQCIIMKQDANYRQGIPDILVLFRGHWAFLECKKSATARHQPNQPWYVAYGREHSFGAFIFPENKDDVLRELELFMYDN